MTPNRNSERLEVAMAAKRTERQRRDTLDPNEEFYCMSCMRKDAFKNLRSIPDYGLCHKDCEPKK